MDYDVIIKFLLSLDSEIYLLIASLLGNFIFIIFKLKGSKLERAYNKAIKNSLIDDYVLKVNGKYYSLEHVHFVKKSEVESEVIL